MTQCSAAQMRNLPFVWPTTTLSVNLTGQSLNNSAFVSNVCPCEAKCWMQKYWTLQDSSYLWLYWCFVSVVLEQFVEGLLKGFLFHNFTPSRHQYPSVEVWKVVWHSSAIPLASVPIYFRQQIEMSSFANSAALCLFLIIVKYWLQ